MITLADYCTTDSVRAVLGVSDEEIEDATIADPIFVITLQEKLTDLNSDLIDAFAGLGGSPTGNALRLKELTQTYAAYIMAQQLLASTPMFAPQIIQDGKAQAARVSDPYAGLRADLLGSLDYMGQRILVVYALLFPLALVTSPVARVFGLNASIAFDPVLNV